MIYPRPINELISIQRLYQQSHFEEIKRYNFKTTEWNEIYPNHKAWVNKVVEELKNQTYERIAFGGFYRNRSAKDVFCSSAIVKKNPFTPYLEIKNLITFKYQNNNLKEELDLKYKDQIIKHIKGYAQQRGFPKLVTELVNRDKKDKSLIRIFLENDFVIAGNQLNRYRDDDDIVYLVADINPLYGYDPYDNLNTSSWILSKFLNCQNLNISKKKEVMLFDESRYKLEPLRKHFYSFVRGVSFENKIKSKFNTSGRLIVLEDYLTSNTGLVDISAMAYDKGDYVEQDYVFDFTQLKVSSSLMDTQHVIFDIDEINHLTGFDEQANFQYRFPYDKVGGFLLISNPEKFPFDRLNQNALSGINSIYLKLGSVGKYVSIEMPLIFAYYTDKSHKSTLMIWGYANLNSTPLIGDIKVIKEEYRDQEELSTNGDYLFQWLEAIDESVPLWTKSEFSKHNSYNATDMVIAYPFENIDIIEPKNRLQLTDFLDDEEYLGDLEKVFDFYLSRNEVFRIEQEILVYNEEKTQMKNEYSIPDQFRVELEEQVSEQYMQILRYRKLKNDENRKTTRKNYEEEIKLRTKNIYEIESTYFEILTKSNKRSSDKDSKIQAEIRKLTNSIEIKLDGIKDNIEKVDSTLNLVLANVNDIVLSIDENEIESDKKIETMADDLVNELTSLMDKHNLLSEQTKDQLSAKLTSGAKLKLTVPIIPGVLKYESDLLSYSGDMKLKSWKDLWNLFVKNK